MKFNEYSSMDSHRKQNERAGLSGVVGWQALSSAVGSAEVLREGDGPASQVPEIPSDDADSRYCNSRLLYKSR